VVFRDPLSSPVKLSRGLLARAFGEATVIDHGPELVIIPAGSFLMGSKEEQYRVTHARPFAIGRYAVTCGEYRAFCEATGRWHYYSKERNSERLRLSVTMVDWDEAVAYCYWLSEQTSQNYRLPSESEWEYACRAGTTTKYSVGDTIDASQANFGASGALSSEGHLRPVGSYPPNPWGLYEMHGNVREWVEDRQGRDAPPADGSAWTAEEGAYVSYKRRLRGGSFYDDGFSASSSSYDLWEQDRTSWHIGLRVVRTLNR
jgi:formylglycine-generating enzyme required for sulfatase activity